MNAPNDGNPKKQLLKRLRIAHGHLGKVIDMADKDDPRGLIRQQLSAVVSALKSVSILLTLEHLSASMEAVDPQITEKIVRELEEILDRSMK